jgi:hypothetical protein
MIDAQAYDKFQDQTARILRPFQEGKKKIDPVHQPWAMASSFAPPPTVLGDDYEVDDEPELPPLTDQQCMLAVPTLKGFFLDRKVWGMCERLS